MLDAWFPVLAKESFNYIVVACFDARIVPDLAGGIPSKPALPLDTSASFPEQFLPFSYEDILQARLLLSCLSPGI